VGIAEHPAGAVGVHDDRKPPSALSGRKMSTLRPFPDIDGRDRRAGDRGLGTLHAIHDLAALGRVELVEERRLGGGVDESLGGRFENRTDGHV
jgi:hypothetical protein